MTLVIGKKYRCLLMRENGGYSLTAHQGRKGQMAALREFFYEKHRNGGGVLYMGDSPVPVSAVWLGDAWEIESLTPQGPQEMRIEVCDG